jgi:hypothetical protein
LGLGHRRRAGQSPAAHGAAISRIVLAKPMKHAVDQLHVLRVGCEKSSSKMQGANNIAHQLLPKRFVTGWGNILTHRRGSRREHTLCRIG